MTHRFPLKEIARQAGLGTATVDRVLHGRAHVSPQTKARVTAALHELEGQEAQLAARGRRMFFDIVIEAPQRFSREVREATEQVLGSINGAVCRPRFLIQEMMREDEVIAALSRITKRGSQGVCLKARNFESIRTAVDMLGAAGIPVVTLVTDIPAQGRIAYAGLDNRSAGRTAAYLIAQSVGNRAGTVLATLSDDRFRGEQDREAAFRQCLQDTCPSLRIVTVSGGRGIHSETTAHLSAVMDQLTDLQGVYSMGGGNRTILEALAHERIRPTCYVAHDLDQENRKLLEQGRLSFVLHHDLKDDMRRVFQAFLGFHKLVPAAPDIAQSSVQIITPANIPPRQISP